MSAPVTITETTWMIVSIYEPLTISDEYHDIYGDYDTAKRDVDRLNRDEPDWRIVRVDSQYTLTPLDAPAGEGGGA